MNDAPEPRSRIDHLALFIAVCLTMPLAAYVAGTAIRAAARGPDAAAAAHPGRGGLLDVWRGFRDALIPPTAEIGE